MNTNDEKIQPLTDDKLTEVTGGIGGPLLGNFINVLSGSGELKSENSISPSKTSVSSGNLPQNVV